MYCMILNCNHTGLLVNTENPSELTTVIVMQAVTTVITTSMQKLGIPVCPAHCGKKIIQFFSLHNLFDHP